MTTQPMTLEQIGQEVIVYVGTRPTEIKTLDDFSRGETWMAGLRKKRKAWQGFFDALLRPHKEAVKQTQATITHLLAPAEEAEARMEGELQSWRTRQRLLAEKEQAKVLEKYEEKVAKAAAKGVDPSELAPPPIIAGPAKSSEVFTWASIKKGRLASDPTATTDTKPKLYANDARLKEIPPEYFLLDWVKIGGACRSGIPVPGVVIYEEESARGR